MMSDAPATTEPFDYTKAFSRTIGQPDHRQDHRDRAGDAAGVTPRRAARREGDNQSGEAGYPG